MRVLIADKHDLFREGIRGAISSYDNSKAVEIADVSVLDEALDLLQSGEKYDLFVLDAKISDEDDLKNITALKRKFPSLPVLIISSDDEMACLCPLKQTGVEGFVYKTVEGDELSRSVQQVVSGQIVFPQTACQHSEEEEGTACDDKAGTEPRRLTPRQRQVLKLMALGKSNRDIAEDLNLAEGTVKIHVTAILRALNVTNRTQAVIMSAHLD